jgi:hypothetical protein
MRNRTLMRPMFRIGGSSGTGITSGLDRPGYRNGPGPNMLDVAGRSLPGNALTNKITPKVDKKPTGIGLGTIPGFITSLGLNLATRTPTGNIFSDIAGAAKDPFDTFQQAKFAEAKEEREFERDKQIQLLKNLDEDSRSALMKQAEEGFEAGLYSSVNEGVRRLLETKEFGVKTSKLDRIDDLVRVAMNQPGVDVKEEPIIRNEITVQQDYKTLTENNSNIDFADQFNMFLNIDLDTQAITNKNLTPGKVYYSGVTDEFFVFNGPDAEKKFTKVDVKR